jgi:uncharacterized protein (UPF0332 family)
MLDTWPDEAARASYLAAFHAAQALIFERTDQIAKTHSGVRTRFALLTREEADFDGALRSFLAQAYNFKAVADYETGDAAEIPRDHAAAAVAMACRFVDRVASLIELHT